MWGFWSRSRLRLLDALGMGGCGGGAAAGAAGAAEDIAVVESVVVLRLRVVRGFELRESVSWDWIGRFSRTALISVGVLAPGCLADAI